MTWRIAVWALALVGIWGFAMPSVFRFSRAFGRWRDALAAHHLLPTSQYTGILTQLELFRRLMFGSSEIVSVDAARDEADASMHFKRFLLLLVLFAAVGLLGVLLLDLH